MFGGAAARAAARAKKKAANNNAANKNAASKKAPPKPAESNSNSNNSNNNSPAPPKKSAATKPPPAPKGAPKPSAASSLSPRREIVPLPTPPDLGPEYSAAALAQAKTDMETAKKAAETGNASSKPMLLQIYLTKLGEYENIQAVIARRNEILAYGVALDDLIQLNVESNGEFKGFTAAQIPKTLKTKMVAFKRDAQGNPLYKPIGWADAPTEEQIRRWESYVRAAAEAANARYPEAAGMENPPPGVNVTKAQWNALTKEQKQSMWGAHTVGKAHDAANPGEPTWKGLAIQLTGQVVSGALSLGTAYAGHYIQGTGRFAAPAIQNVGTRAVGAAAGAAASSAVGTAAKAALGKGGYRTKRSVRRSTKTRRTRN